MLKPAILYKDKITEEYCKKFYSKDMFFESGNTESYVPEISCNPKKGCYEYAIVNKEDKVIGYLSYYVDFYVSSVFNIELISFDKGNPIIGYDTFNKLEELISKYHRVEWGMIVGNPAERSYNKFLKKHNGTKHIYRDYTKDEEGNYHDYIVYEIVSGEK